MPELFRFGMRKGVKAMRRKENCIQATFVLDETLKVDSWEHPEKIQIVKVTFVLPIFVHIRNISVIMCYWPDFDKKFCTQIFWDPNFCGPIFLNLAEKVFGPNLFLGQKFFWTNFVLNLEIFLFSIFQDSKFCVWQNFKPLAWYNSNINATTKWKLHNTVIWVIGTKA